jgi:hypothetical protein
MKGEGGIKIKYARGKTLGNVFKVNLREKVRDLSC